MGSLPRLVAVVEVDKDDRIICQAEGCGHSVYKRIHVVQNNNRITVIGSECFKRLYGGMEHVPQTPLFGSSEGRRLSAEERTALLENTERLVASLEAEHLEAEKARELQRQEAEREAASRMASGSGARRAFGRRISTVIDILAGMSEAQLKNVCTEAKAVLQLKHPSANLDAVDWQVIVEAEMRSIVRRRRYGRS